MREPSVQFPASICVGRRPFPLQKSARARYILSLKAVMAAASFGGRPGISKPLSDGGNFAPFFRLCLQCVLHVDRESRSERETR